MTPPAPAPPSGATFNVAAVRQHLATVSARGLSRFMIVFGLFLIGVVAVDALVRRPGLGPAWSGFAVMTLATGLAGALLLRFQHARAAASLMLVLASLAIAWNAWTIGLGIHSAGLAGLCLLMALAGLLVGLRAALLLALLYGAAVAAMAWAEMAGVLEGRRMVAVTPIANRLIGLSMLGFAGLVAAYVFNRLVTQVMTDAIGEQDRLSELLRIGSDWSWEMDAKARMTFLSPSFEAGAGRTREEFMRIGEPGGPQIVDDAQSALLRQELRERRPYRDREITFRCADGTLLVVRGNGEPVFVDGSFVGWRGVSRNVTADRLADIERRRNDQLLDRLVRLSPDPICVARLSDGRILLANPAFGDRLATPDVVGRSAAELGLWDGVGQARRLVEALRRNGGVVRNLRTVVQLPGRSPRVMLLTAASFDWDGDPVAVITTRDVTDVERSRLEADAILDNAGIGIALVREQRFERVNPTFESMFGRAPGTLAAQPIAALFLTQADFDDFHSQALTRQAEGGAIDIEREIRLPDERTIQARLRARPIDARHPGAAGTIWVAEDITARRQFERDLAEAKRQAEAANEAKSAFLATMSHEIRTPLNGIHGLARLLQDGTLASERRAEYLGHLLSAADHLSGVVSDVLDLSKIEAGRLQLEDVDFDLHALVASTYRTFEALGQERGLAMACTIAPDAARHVRGDPVRVRQILANYLSNALKFTARGSVAVWLGTGRDGRVRLEVRDTGIGVAPELHGRLFQPFMQADSSTTRHYGGTGLGLSICQELALRMGGEVGLDSPASGGCLFWAELPLPAADEPAAELTAAASGSRPLKGLRVLVAEDNPVNMLIVSEMLQRQGAQVLQAEDGASAIEVAGREASLGLHAVLLDLHMPRVDGLTAARRLRDDPRTASIVRVAMSAAVLDHDRQAAEEAGMQHFIAKPVTDADLLRYLGPLAAGPRLH
jgi:PAS domain S-box-containing protein